MGSKFNIQNLTFKISLRKEVRTMLRVTIVIAAILLVVSGSAFARGTAAGTQFTNISVQA